MKLELKEYNWKHDPHVFQDQVSALDHFNWLELSEDRKMHLAWAKLNGIMVACL